jgi:hypothetical protein
MSDVSPLELLVRPIGPRNREKSVDAMTVNTTSHAKGTWQADLSPFNLGPVTLWDGRVSQTMENGWQYSKVYYRYLGGGMTPTKEWHEWSSGGFNNNAAVRYPMGKGQKPVWSWWNNKMLGYVDARKQIYIPLYRDSVRKTAGWQTLRTIFKQHVQEAGLRLQLWDYDAYPHIELGYTLNQVVNDGTRTMGHAFVLAMMLIYGEDFEPDKLPARR